MLKPGINIFLQRLATIDWAKKIDPNRIMLVDRSEIKILRTSGIDLSSRSLKTVCVRRGWKHFFFLQWMAALRCQLESGGFLNRSLALPVPLHLVAAGALGSPAARHCAPLPQHFARLEPPQRCDDRGPEGDPKPKLGWVSRHCDHCDGHGAVPDVLATSHHSLCCPWRTSKLVGVTGISVFACSLWTKHFEAETATVITDHQSWRISGGFSNHYEISPGLWQLQEMVPTCSNPKICKGTCIRCSHIIGSKFQRIQTTVSCAE